MRIDNNIWVGNVELHLKEKDWFNHNHHHHDAQYDNIILHVICEKEPSKNLTGHRTLNLYPSIKWECILEYQKLMDSMDVLACRSYLPKLNQHRKSLWLESLGLERLLEKLSSYSKSHNTKEPNLDYHLLYLIVRSFGFSANSIGFETLSDKLTPFMLQRIKDKPKQIETLLLGLAGFYLSPEEGAEFQLLSNKFKVTPISDKYWVKGAVRPSNSPLLRLKQLSRLLCVLGELSELLSLKTEKYDIVNFMASIDMQPQLSKSVIDHIIINAIAPFVFIVGKSTSNTEFTDYGMSLLTSCKAESNRFVKLYKDAGMTIENALESQGALRLFKHYCRPKKCLNCAIGNELILKHD